MTVIFQHINEQTLQLKAQIIKCLCLQILKMNKFKFIR